MQLTLKGLLSIPVWNNAIEKFVHIIQNQYQLQELLTTYNLLCDVVQTSLTRIKSERSG